MTRRLMTRRIDDDASFHPGEFFSALLKQLYIGQPYVPRNLYVPVDFEDREELEDLLSEQVAGGGARATLSTFWCRSAADKRALIDLCGDERQAVLRPAIPRAQTKRQKNSGRVAGDS